VEDDSAPAERAGTAEGSQPESGEQLICYSCGAEVPAGESHCPVCGKRQLRTCFCGARISVTTLRCPECGADWSQSARSNREAGQSGDTRVKRKSRSQRVRSDALGSHAVIGALAALLLAGLISLSVTRLASQALEPGETMPPSFSAKLGLAAAAVRAGVTRVGRVLSGHAHTLIAGLALMACGAALGALYYLHTLGFLPWGRRPSRKRRKRPQR